MEARDPSGPGRSRRPRALTVLRIAAFAALLAALAVLALTGTIPSVGEIRDFGDDLGAVGPFVWPFLFALLNFVIPWPILTGATGLLFGTAAGTALALAGVLLASAAQFAVARRVTGDGLRRRVQERVPRIDALLASRGFLAVFYSRIIPGVVWGLVNYASGLARVRLRDLLLATVLGGTPKIFAYVALGGNLDDLSKPEAKVAIALMIALALGGLGIARRELPPRKDWSRRDPPPA